MDQVTILTARAIAWVDVADLNPRGHIYYPSLIEAFVERFGFKIFPKEAADFDETKGVKFGIGRDGDDVIDQVVIYTRGIALDARNSTSDSQRILTSALEWGAENIGLAYSREVIRFWQYYSQISFRSPSLHLALIHPAIAKLSANLGKSIEEISGETLTYEPTNIQIGHDPTLRRHSYGHFSLQRKDAFSFHEDSYFSDAPLSTARHLLLLETLESDLAKG